MKMVAILSLLTILPLGAHAGGVSQAEQHCRQMVDHILSRKESGSRCRQFHYDAFHFYSRDEVSFEFNGMKSNEELNFGGHNCGSRLESNNVNSILLTFLPVNRTEQEPQCAIWQFSLDDQGNEIIRRSIYIGDRPVQSSTMNRAEYDLRGVTRDLQISGRTPEEIRKAEQPTVLQRIFGGSGR